jgi:hypothetical protein
LTASSDQNSPQTLEYGLPPSKRRRWVLRGTILLCVLIAVAAIVSNWRDLTRWYERARIRHAAMTHTAAADTVVMTQLPQDIESTWSSTINQRYLRSNKTWQQTENQLAPQLAARPGSDVTLFLHEMRSPSGNRRVLSANISMAWSKTGTWLRADIRLFDPGSLRNARFTDITIKERDDTPVSGHIPGFPGTLITMGTVPWGNHFKLFAAQLDRQDRSRLVIPYQFNGQRGEFIGQLHDDDSISIKPADGGTLPKKFPKAQ